MRGCRRCGGLLSISLGRADADDACGQVQVAAPERGCFSPAQTGEGGQEHESAVAPVMVVVGSAVLAHGPQSRFGGRPAGVDVRCGAHGAMPPVPQPVTAIRQAPDVADRAAADQFGQFEDLCHGQDRAFGCPLGSGAPDAARVPGKDLVLFHSCGEARAEQPIRLGRHGDRYAAAQQLRSPLTDHRRGQPAQRHSAEVGVDVLAAQPRIPPQSGQIITGRHHRS